MTRRPPCVVAGCDTPVTGRLCHDHLAKLVRDLRAVGWLTVELELTATRQARSSAGGDAGTDPGLPLAWNASDLAWVLANTLHAWVVHLDPAAGLLSYTVAGAPLDPAAPAPRRARHLAAYLIARRDRIRDHPDAAQVHDEITWVVRATRTAVFGPGPLMALGPCVRCHHALHAARDQPAVRCPRCEVEYDVAARRRDLLTRARDQLLTATELSRALPELLGEHMPALTVDRIYQWTHRGRLVQRPGRRYLIADVLALLEVDLGETMQRPDPTTAAGA